MSHYITREISIDAGHRIPNHDSKCRGLHGHRYVIHATIKGPLIEQGSEEGMVMDFSFLKEIMVKHIHDVCDHALILWCKDSLIKHWKHKTVVDTNNHPKVFEMIKVPDVAKIIIIPMVPTAENLARHWYHAMSDSFSKRDVPLTRVEVFETPNCSAMYTERD